MTDLLLFVISHLFFPYSLDYFCFKFCWITSIQGTWVQFSKPCERKSEIPSVGWSSHSFLQFQKESYVTMNPLWGGRKPLGLQCHSYMGQWRLWGLGGLITESRVSVRGSVGMDTHLWTHRASIMCVQAEAEQRVDVADRLIDRQVTWAICYLGRSQSISVTLFIILVYLSVHLHVFFHSLIGGSSILRLPPSNHFM